MKNIVRLRSEMLLFILFVLGFIPVLSCKKEPNIDTAARLETPSENAVYEIKNDSRDSAYFWTKEYYLWTELLPSFEVFNPRSLPDIFAVMAKVRNYQPLDRFSFVEKKSDPRLPTTDIVLDMGFSVKFFSGTHDLRVNYVNPDSPSGLAGIKRGWKVLQIDGRTVRGDSQAEIDFLNDVFWGTTPVHRFLFQKRDGSTVELVIREGVYRSLTVFSKTVFDYPAKKIGYFVYNQFGAAASAVELRNAIADLTAQGISDLIVDLRYNRGGFLSTQEVLANLLAPVSVGNRQVMFRYMFNSRHPELNVSINFNKAGSLNLNRIVFIVSPSTASASEVLINSLKPVMEVKLIGDRRTFGKPVGFFPISVFEYNIYPVSFKTANSLGYADYYQGFPVNKQVNDDLNHDFGDPQEACLKEALIYLSTGRFSGADLGELGSASSALIFDLNQKLEHRPALTIEHRPERIPQQN